MNSYDSVPYPSTARPKTHPEYMATIASLFGMSPPPVERCRVLELGCSDGGNLIPMAYTLPGSQFVGIDLSERQVAGGRALIDELGLGNITLTPMNILDWAEGSVEPFDYIIVYGVFSWVPRPVQEKILSICKRDLSPDGVAYVSYNVYPGWHTRGMLRDMAMYYANRFDDLRERAGRARGFIDFMAHIAPTLIGSVPENKAYGMLLEDAKQRFGEYQDSYFIHEYLEEVNEPLYFHQFAERAQQHGLQYLGEAELPVMMTSHFPSDAVAVLDGISRDIIDREQFMDFLRNRMFRQTLLCHAGVPVRRDLRPEQVTAYHVASPVQFLSDNPDVCSETLEKFRSPAGTIASTSKPVNKAALLYLSAVWPRAVAFDRLFAVARRMARGEAEAGDEDHMEALLPGAEADAAVDRYNLCDTLLQSYAVDLAELHVRAPQVCLDISDRPVASPVARLQARHGRTVANLRHEAVTIDDEASLQLLRCLDGQHSRPALLGVLSAVLPESADHGNLTQGERAAPGESGQLAGTENEAAGGGRRRDLEAELDGRLHALARQGLLIG